MANALLVVDEALKERFRAVQEDRSVRWLRVSIANECIVLLGEQAASPSVEADFNALVETLEQNVPSYILFCEDVDASADAARHWVLISWIPDLSRPRDKMLFSSSRDNMKRTLGIGYFTHEYYVNEHADLTWDTYQQSISKQEAVPLSEAEMLAKEESRLEKDTSIRSNAMGEIPFEFLPEATEGFSQFTSKAVNLVMLALEGEQITGKGCLMIDTASAGTISSALPSLEEPLFLLLRLPASSGSVERTVFVYFCPDEAKVRQRMIYSTAKATVVAALSSYNITTDKVIEARSAEDLNAIPSDQDAAEGASAGGAASVVDTGVKKPARPGRGKRPVVKKFVADTD